MKTRPACVLCVDDDEFILQLLERVLQNACYEVLMASDGEAACACVTKHQPDLVLLDLYLPGIDGFETCRRIMNVDPKYAPTVIFLSSDGAPEVIAEGLHLGAADFLRKPVMPAELLLRVGNHIRIRDQDVLLRRYSEQLEGIVAERTKALIHADRLASLGTLAAGTAHELNNPTAVIRGNIGTLRLYWKSVTRILERYVESEEDQRVGVVLEEMPKLLDGMTRATARIADIVSGLLRFGARRQADKKPIDVARLITESLELTHNRLKYGATVTQDISAAATIMGNATELSQVFVNLLTNAADAISEQATATIRITTWITNGKLAIALDDNGPGIPKELETRITQPFFTTKPIGKGTGLGLPICIGIIEDHGGTLQFSNRASGGFRARIELPLYEDHENIGVDPDDKPTRKAASSTEPGAAALEPAAAG